MSDLYVDLMYAYAKRKFDLLQQHLKPGTKLPETSLFPEHLTDEKIRYILDTILEANMDSKFNNPHDLLTWVDSVLDKEFGTTWVLPMIEFADKFAEYKHGDPTAKDHERKGGGAYIQHPRNVKENLIKICSHYRHRSNPEVARVLISALLHDVLEGTNTYASEIRCLFGEPVLFIVCGCTKVEALVGLNVDLPKIIFNPEHDTSQHYASACLEVQDIKTADAIDNIAGFYALGSDYAPEYAEKKRVLHSKFFRVSPALSLYLNRFIQNFINGKVSQ